MGMPKLNLSSGGMIASGLAQGLGVAADHYGMVDKQQIMDESDARRQAALEAKERRMAVLRNELDLAKEDELYKRGETRKSEERSRVSGLLQSARDESNGVDGPGGYDPKAYNNLDETGKAEFDLNTLINSGEIDPAKAVEFKLNRNDKNAIAEAKLENAQRLLELRSQWENAKTENAKALIEAKIETLKAQAARAEAGPKPTDLQLVAAAKARIGTPQEKPTDKAMVELYSKEKTTYDTVSESEEVYDESSGSTKKVTRTKKVPTGGSPAAPGSKPWERFKR